MKKFIVVTIILGTAFTACVDPIAEQRRMNDAITQEVIRDMRHTNEMINQEVQRQMRQDAEMMRQIQQQAMRDANPYNPNF